MVHTEEVIGSIPVSPAHVLQLGGLSIFTVGGPFVRRGRRSGARDLDHSCVSEVFGALPGVVWRQAVWIADKTRIC